MLQKYKCKELIYVRKCTYRQTTANILFHIKILDHIYSFRDIFFHKIESKTGSDYYYDVR